MLLKLPTDLSLEIIAPLIAEEVYWKRRAIDYFKACEPLDHSEQWKRLFFEKYVGYLLESYIPNNLTDDKCDKTLPGIY